ncbi:hypothetical protein [Bifidobacterium cuniculi]|uniref:Phage protein n=1 Tax=Bifidobacterium cuniculi TaxID=1688 RepID=A0A087B406_9BIFI|nr:hypothetical protein [Bifidobacterium cuniculi]KFI65756.1 hypothetical protein BCUN_0251 [Bifidobacterium cuniculi]
MIEDDYETVCVYRPTVEFVDGRKVPGALERVGRARMLVAPVAMERVLDTGRTVMVDGFDLYARGHADIDMRVGDVLGIRGYRATITESPAMWKRGDRVVGWHWHAELKEDL